MTEIFRGGATNNYPLEYVERKKYINFLRSLDYNFLDTLYEKPLYGFLDKNYNVIAPSLTAEREYDGESFGNYAEGVLGLSFVTNQFNKFRRYYISTSLNSSVKFPDLVSQLEPVASYENFENSYEQYSAYIMNILVAKALDEGLVMERPITSFENFIRFINTRIFDADMISQPLTKTGFLLSQNSNVYNTGLYISLSDVADWRIEQTKADFIKDENFACFVEKAANFGFYVDAHYPWRIAVNLESEYTQRQLLNGRPRSQFYNFYSDTWTIKVGRDDFDAIKKLYERIYLEYLTKLQIRVINSNTSFTARAETRLLLESLLICKFKELSLIIKPDENNSIFREVLANALDKQDRYGLTSIPGSLGYINDFCSNKLKEMILGTL